MAKMRRLISLVLAVSLCAITVFATTGTEGKPEDTTGGYLSEYEDAITRAEFCNLTVSLLSELLDIPVDEMYNKLTDKQKNESFGDVGENGKYIAIAKKYELVQGTDIHQFTPNAPIKRQEVATIILNLVRIAAPEYYDEDFDYGDELNIGDHVEIAKWARDAVDFVIFTELMELDKNENFDPTAPMSAEEADMLVSAVNIYLKTPLPEEEPEEEPEEPGIPAYVWIIVASAAAVIVTIIIVALVVSSNRKKEAKRKSELRMEQELNRMISVTEKSVAPAAPQRIYRQDVPQPRSDGKIPPASGKKAAGGKTAGAVKAPAPDKAPVRPRNAGGGETVFVGEVQCPRIRITAVQGVELDRQFVLDMPLTVGRAEDNVLQIPNATISRYHCRIRWDGARVIAEDVAARNPIKILRAGAELPVAKETPTPVENGDVLLLGGVRLKVNL